MITLAIIKIRLESLEWVDVPGISFGTWCAHQIREAIYDADGRLIDEPEGGWRVTHTPSGASPYTRADDLDYADAVRVARRLADECPMSGFTGPAPGSNGPAMALGEDGYIVESILAEELAA